MTIPAVGRQTRWGAIGLLVTMGCSELTKVCTLIGCDSGVRVHLSALPSQPFRVDIGTPGSDVAYVFDCTNDSSRCRQDILFPDLIADHLFITVHVGAASRVTEIVQVTYTHSRPNGPNCSPDCQTADVIAAIPT